MNRLKHFFWLCAGADKKLLEKCPTESSKYVGIGASVLFTGIFAAIAGGYALHTVFDRVWIAIFFGIVWGLMIFNLDRFIVASMRKNGKPRQEFAMAAPRIFLAIIISLVIAKPLELKIFEKEVDSELVLIRQEDAIVKEQLIRDQYKTSTSTLKAEINQLQNDISGKEQKRDELRRIAREEADGTGGTKRRNAGPIYRIKKADADRVEEELAALKKLNEKLISEKLGQIRENESTIQTNISSLTPVQLNGLASRMEALDRLTDKSGAIAIAHWFIILLFIALETAPILVKMIAPRGPYDYLLKTLEYGFEANHYQDQAKTNATVKKKIKHLSQEEVDYVTDQLRLGLER